MKKSDIEKLRMNLGKYLHTYYAKFGEEKYNKFLEKLGRSMMKSYGEPFSADNLRIMEAEYVTLSSPIDGKNKKDIK
ncbi:MAG TPA: hypothetical protein DCY94_00365 [Firmicutes bacterium]|nr:hypothetical protein [Bacillota bacterium]